MSETDFIGREEEIAFLEDLWNQKGFVTCTVWGRRRIGKSTILNRFMEGKRALYLQGIEGSYYENLSSLSLDVSKFLEKEIPQAKDLTHLMEIIEDICREEHTLLIIDELPYLLRSAPQASSVIQKSIDRVLKNTDCMFVICGSSISVMRRETENSNRPLYGRFEHTLQVKGLSPEACRKLHPEMDDETSLRWYCTVGGIPMYHRIKNGSSFSELVKSRFLGHIDSWRNDAPNVILQEFNGKREYTGAVRCIADGSVRQSEIAEKMHIDRAECKRILDDLEFVGILERRMPMAGAPKKPVYSIKDPFIAFHYKVLSPNMRSIDNSRSPDALYYTLENDISSHIGHVFESLCGEWLDSNYPVLERGQWWGRIDGEDTDIDIVAKIADNGRTIRTIVGECKFSKRPMGFGTVNTLKSRANSAGLRENVSFALFSALGFEKELEECAEENDIALIDGSMILGEKKPPELFRTTSPIT